MAQPGDSDGSDRTERQRRFPSVFYNAITWSGAILASLSLVMIVFLFALELFSARPHPYMGILAFVVMPAFLLLGVAMIVGGAVREWSRHRRGLPPPGRLPRLDLNKPRQRRIVLYFTSGAVALAALSAFGSFQAYEYTESNAFCGQVCHTVMHPEYTTYQESPHARVECVECHIGPGAEWFVRSKLAGTYQMYAVATGSFPRPIPTPIENLRPSRETCEHCHWPAWFAGDNLSERNYYLSDEQNTHTKLSLLVKVGGGDPQAGERSGIHWHMFNAARVDYLASDERRLEIPWIRVTDRKGQKKIYVARDSEFDPASDAVPEGARRMDCLDCHNRPAHEFHVPMERVNDLMARGRLDPSIPDLKGVAVQALEAGYPDTETAMEGIAASVRDHYREARPEVLESRRGELDVAIETLRQIYRSNYFPLMNASWRDYPDHSGHLYSPGCFRCHDGNHVAEDGSVISNDCNVCHTLLSPESNGDGGPMQLTGTEFQHPADVGGAWQFLPCTDCHGS